MALIDVKVPDIGDFKDVSVIEMLVKPGDRVAVDQSLITVESDKASMEIPSSAAGVVKELKVKLGDKVNQGSTVLVLEADGAAPRRRPRLQRRQHRRRVPLRPRRSAHRPPRRTPGASTSSAICSCWAADPAATRVRSVRPTSA